MIGEAPVGASIVCRGRYEWDGGNRLDSRSRVSVPPLSVVSPRLHEVCTACPPCAYQGAAVVPKLATMAAGKRKTPQKRKTKTRGGLVREVCYMYEDEAQALGRLADEERCSKSEIMRRALRAYLRIVGSGA